MMSTIIVIALLLGLMVGSLLLWVMLLRLGLRWAKVEDVTRRRIVIATILVLVVQVVFECVSGLAESYAPELVSVLGVVGLGFAVLIPWFVVQHVFKTSSGRALGACVPTFLTPIVVLALGFLVIRPFLFEPFVIPTNSMAPTLLGNHSVGTCVECEGPAYGSPVSRGDARWDSPQMICRDNFHVSQPTECGDQEFKGDRLLVAKFLRPKRWDLIVFRYPEDPSVLYVFRLVGLPGEEITIQNDQVLADGQVLTPPDSIEGIKYSDEMPYWREEVWGSPDHPAKLADDEYFVLGDFPQSAKDSRLWSHSPSGRSPFAVPESDVLGVVTHIYWPLDRWRVFR